MKNVLLAFLGVIFFYNTAIAAEYTIDKAHSEVTFKVKHLGISYVYGNFGEFEGTYTFEPTTPSESSVQATIKTTSIDTGNSKRDDHLRNPDFFEASAYPLITYRSKAIENASASGFKVIGDLTMHGVTKEVVLDVVYNGAATDPGGNERTAFSATTELNRKDFGLTWNKLLETGGVIVGDEIKINLEIAGIKTKD
jgi:polyisoprenoid-binding protein YceI